MTDSPDPNALRTRRNDVRTPVTILSGFLGSGKTTLLNRALADASMARTVVVVNEFGDVSIDHSLIRSSSDSIVVLENGCLCCTVFGDLVQTFNRLYYAREARNIDFDHVVIETSGLADLTTVQQAFLSEPTLEGLYRVGAIVTTVDAVNGMQTLSEQTVSAGQVALADSLLITKLDLLPQGERQDRLTALSVRLRRLNRGALLATADDPQVNPVGLFRRSSPDPARGSSEAKAWLELAISQGPEAQGPAAQSPAVQGSEHDHSHSHDATPRSDPGHLHDPTVASFSFIREEPLTREALQLLLSSLERQLGPGLLRVKGLIHVSEEPERPAVIQGAQHLLHNLTWLDAWPDSDRRTRIVFITQGIAATDLAEMINLLDRVAARTAKARARAAERAAGTTP